MPSPIINRRVVLGAAGFDPLRTGLAAFWKLDEASGTRVDAVGTSHLSDNNTVTQAAGKGGNAAQFVAANSEYLSCASNALVQTGDIDFSLAGWVYHDTLPGLQTYVARSQGGAQEYHLRSNSGSLNFQVLSGTTLVGSISHGSALSAATWYFWCAYHDSVNNLVGLSINAGVPATAATTGPMATQNIPITLGARGALDNFLNGRLDNVGLWRRVLTAAERTRLYNGGAGLTHPFAS